jgi:hypothetical protein
MRFYITVNGVRGNVAHVCAIRAFPNTQDMEMEHSSRPVLTILPREEKLADLDSVYVTFKSCLLNLFVYFPIRIRL